MTRNILHIIVFLSCCVSTFYESSAQLTDQSDAVFSIVIPAAEAQDIDMGFVLVGDTRDTLVSSFLRNIGRTAIRIDDAEIHAGAIEHFAVTGGVPPVILHEGDEHDMAFSFTPLSPGRFEAEMRIVTQVDTMLYRIFGEGILPQIEVVSRHVDFGVLPVGAVRDTLVSVMLRNLTAGPVRIRTIRLSGPDTVQFTIRDGAEHVTLPPFGTHAMALRFAPRQGGRSSSSITFEIERGIDRPVALLFGEGVAVSASATLLTDTLRAPIGEVITLPIRLRHAERLQLAGATTLVSQLRFRASVLVPTGATPEGWIEDGWRTIPLDNLPRLPIREDIIAEYTLMPVLGKEELTPLILQNSEAIGADVSLTEIPGLLLLDDLCREGGTRLFDGDARVALAQNAPNPFNSRTTIMFDVLERGLVRLLLMNVEGRIVRVLFDSYAEPGTYTVFLDAGALPSGTYVYELRSGRTILQRRMQLLK